MSTPVSVNAGATGAASTAANLAANPVATTAAGAAGAALAGAASSNASSMEEVLKILKREGMIDDGEEQKMLAKYAAERKSIGPKWLEGTNFTGDFRIRYEGQFFDDDELGVDADTRNRYRYRARFGFTKQFGSAVRLGVRLASGTNDRRSADTSFGDGDNDQFNPDSIFFDRAFLQVQLQDSARVKTSLTVGKLENPFLSSYGEDKLLFDSDINMEGVFLTTSFRPNETTRFYATGGGFIIDEVAAAKDPSLYAGQIGLEKQFSTKVLVGLRASTYQYRSLDDNFAMLSATNGNLPGVSFDGRASLGETRLFARLDFSENWPLLLYGTVVKNFSAENGTFPIVVGMADMAMTVGSVRTDAEDMAYSYGFEVGNASKFVKLGLGVFEVQANSVVAQFTDSDPLGGLTNREGFLLYASRKLNPFTELRFSYFDSDEIKSSGGPNGPFKSSLGNADRKLGRVDLSFAF